MNPSGRRAVGRRGRRRVFYEQADFDAVVPRIARERLLSEVQEKENDLSDAIVKARYCEQEEDDDQFEKRIAEEYSGNRKNAVQKSRQHSESVKMKNSEGKNEVRRKTSGVPSETDDDPGTEDSPDRSFSWLLGPTSDEAVLDAVTAFVQIQHLLQNPIENEAEEGLAERVSDSKSQNSGPASKGKGQIKRD